MWDVPHGVTSCITLPHVMRFMADVAPERFGPIAEGLGVHFDERDARAGAKECAERMAKFIAQFEVPHRLRDADVPREEIGTIAATVLEEVERADTVGRSSDAREHGPVVGGGLLEGAATGGALLEKCSLLERPRKDSASSSSPPAAERRRLPRAERAAMQVHVNRHSA